MLEKHPNTREAEKIPESKKSFFNRRIAMATALAAGIGGFLQERATPEQDNSNQTEDVLDTAAEHETVDSVGSSAKLAEARNKLRLVANELGKAAYEKFQDETEHEQMLTQYLNADLSVLPAKQLMIDYTQSTGAQRTIDRIAKQYDETPETVRKQLEEYVDALVVEQDKSGIVVYSSMDDNIDLSLYVGAREFMDRMDPAIEIIANGVDIQEGIGLFAQPEKKTIEDDIHDATDAILEMFVDAAFEASYASGAAVQE